MLKKVKLLFFTFFCTFLWSQNGFEFKEKSKKIIVPFKLVNNLVIIPVDVNGTKLNFLLDTGVSETLLFSLDETEQVKFENIEKVKFAGFGNNEPFDGFKSSKNRIQIKNFVDNNHTIYIVLDQQINISSQVGFPINGVIGKHFFQNNPIEIRYKRNKVIIYNDIVSIAKKIEKSYTKIPISIEEGKPYIQTKVGFINEAEPIDAKMLIDTGNTDALWLFSNKSPLIKIPKLVYEDFLGRGFSGNIYGKRGRLESFEMAQFKFKEPLISFPDSIVTSAFNMVKNRVGSVGSEIMKRFNTIYDYQNQVLYVKKNQNFILPFNFNMSGMDVQHDGLQWVTETYQDNSSSKVTFDNSSEPITRNLRYKFLLKPTYSILSVTKNSPADGAGLKVGDMILKINGTPAHNYTLQEIKDILKSEEGRIITIEVERKGVVHKTKFELKSIL